MDLYRWTKHRVTGRWQESDRFYDRFKKMGMVRKASIYAGWRDIRRKRWQKWQVFPNSFHVRACISDLYLPVISVTIKKKRVKKPGNTRKNGWQVFKRTCHPPVIKLSPQKRRVLIDSPTSTGTWSLWPPRSRRLYEPYLAVYEKME